MEREIKFRAFQEGQMLIMPISTNYSVYRFFGILSDDTPVMQFTSSKDKNGTDIYEGDLLSIELYDEQWETKVKFESSTFIIDVINCDYNSTSIGFLDDEAIVEVIGNIYQNPELLNN